MSSPNFTRLQIRSIHPSNFTMPFTTITTKFVCGHKETTDLSNNAPKSALGKVIRWASTKRAKKESSSICSSCIEAQAWATSRQLHFDRLAPPCQGQIETLAAVRTGDISLLQKAQITRRPVPVRSTKNTEMKAITEMIANQTALEQADAFYKLQRDREIRRKPVPVRAGLVAIKRKPIPTRVSTATSIIPPDLQNPSPTSSQRTNPLSCDHSTRHHTDALY